MNTSRRAGVFVSEFLQVRQACPMRAVLLLRDYLDRSSAANNREGCFFEGRLRGCRWTGSGGASPSCQAGPECVIVILIRIICRQYADC